MTSMDSPSVNNAILSDIPAIRNMLRALAKLDPSTLTNLQDGTVKFVFNDSIDKFTVQRLQGGVWQTIHNFSINADSVGGVSASYSMDAHTLPIRDATGKINADLNGNAKTASTAAALSQPNPVAMGGTGGTNAAEARSNLSVPSKVDLQNVSNALYDGIINMGLAQREEPLRDHTNDVFALQPHNAQYVIYGGDNISNLPSNKTVGLIRIMSRIDNTAGHMFFLDYTEPRIWYTITTEGAGNWIPWIEVTVPNATTVIPGKVALSTSTTSTSISMAATSSAVKSAMDKANLALPKSGGTVTGTIELSSGSTTSGITKYALTEDDYANIAFFDKSISSGSPSNFLQFHLYNATSSDVWRFYATGEMNVPDSNTLISLLDIHNAVSDASNAGQIGGVKNISGVSLFSIVEPGTYGWSSTAGVTDQPSGLTNGYGTMLVVADAAGYGVRWCFDRSTLNTYSSVVHPQVSPAWKLETYQAPQNLNIPLVDYTQAKGFAASQVITINGMATISGYSGSSHTIQVMQKNTSSWVTIGSTTDSHAFSFQFPVGVGDKVNWSCTVFPFRTY